MVRHTLYRLKAWKRSNKPFRDMEQLISFFRQGKTYLFNCLQKRQPRVVLEDNPWLSFLENGYCERRMGIFIVDGEIVPFNGKCVSIIYDGKAHIAKSIQPEKSNRLLPFFRQEPA